MSSGAGGGLPHMTTFVLVPGAGGDVLFWHRLVPELERRGHRALPVALPVRDDSAGLEAYTDAVVRAIGDRSPVVLVAQSMGAFTALGACGRIAVRGLVLVNAMVPAPGETPREWWAATGWEADRIAAARAGGYAEAFDLDTYFLHDVPLAVAAAGAEHDRGEADIAFTQPCDFARWPDVPTAVFAGRDDRFFPLAFQRRVTRERVGLDVRELPGGHLNALSEPQAVAAALLAAA